MEYQICMVCFLPLHSTFSPFVLELSAPATLSSSACFSSLSVQMKLRRRPESQGQNHASLSK